MKKFILFPFCLLLLLLSGCSSIGNKDTSLTVIYGVLAVLSLLLLVLYCCLLRKKNIWFLLLYSGIFVVNTGYFTLGISKTLEEALLANRISYLGSVFLPMAMLMIILHVSHLHFPKWLPGVLLFCSLAIFFVAASPGYLPIYYKEVSLVVVNGVSVLQKVYGPWHCLYLYYLLIYFSATIGTTVYAILKKKVSSPHQTLILLFSVFINLGVWLLGQLVEMEFEFLSVSYVISEIFLLTLFLTVQEQGIDPIPAEIPTVVETAESASPITPQFAEQCEHFVSALPSLTQTERTIYNLYLEGKHTKDIMEILGIKENTVKYHNKNIYSKLGVSSRKQLLEIAQAIK